MVIRTHSSKKRTAYLLIAIMVCNCLAPLHSWALTGGPSQPEVQSFEPIGTSEMVDVSTGSFVYNIPLLEVGGYPINLAYHAGATPDDEASVCGLGWNINPGVLNRNLRGLPDDFDGDVVQKRFNMKPNKTWGGGQGFKAELFGLSKKEGSKKVFNLKANLGVFYNNYKGVGFEFGLLPSFSAGDKASFTTGLGLSANSQSGISISPTVKFSRSVQVAEKNDAVGNLQGGLSIGAPVNSRQGLKSLSISSAVDFKGTKIGTVTGINEQGQEVSYRKDYNFKSSLFGGSSSFSFATPSYSPQPGLSFSNFSISGAFTLGYEVAGLHPAGTISGYYSEQKLQKKASSAPAFGFLYAHNAIGTQVLMDFNREKDGPFTKHTPNLPLPVFTSDIYGATGQGISGSYQLKRGDIGVLSDPWVQSSGFGGSISGEVGAGALPPGFHGGADIVVNKTDSRSHAWKKDNEAADHLTFRPPVGNSPGYEAAYFKIAGEKSVETDPDFFQKNGGKNPVRVKLEAGKTSNMEVKAKAQWEGAGGLLDMDKTYRGKRERRNQSIAYLTAGEAAVFGLEKVIKDYPVNDFSASPASIGRTSVYRKSKHLSEVTLLRQDGLRYVYGIPVYNTSQKEVSFSTNRMGTCSSGLVNYLAGEDSPENTSGSENYFNEITLPAYAHSYLLTAIVSQDYVDITGDGPTPDDYGSYTKFNYSRVAGNYAWRVPYANNTANFNEGFKSDNNDNKANYLSGTKEYWVLHSVESKTHVAEFMYNTTARTDAKSATGQILPRLERITLYSLPDRKHNQVAAPVPVKTVWFEYDQSLCPVLPYSGGGGKLTLKKLWFTYGDSQKGKLSPYQFNYGQYGTTVHNPQYGLKNYNRWGSYQENKALTNSNCYNNSVATSPLSTSDYPYVPQAPAEADKNAHAYNLTEIKLPSGGIIRVEYEANRYAYTQNRRAMEMIEVVGANNSKIFSTANNLYNNSNPNNFLFFKLRNDLPKSQYTSPTAAKLEIGRQYLNGAFAEKSIDQAHLYFKFLVNAGQPSSPAAYEFVPGYARIKDYGVVESTGGASYTHGYVQLDNVTCDDGGVKDASPIAKAAWQFTRLYLPKIAYGESNVNENSGAEQIIRAVASMAKQMAQFVDGFNDYMRGKSYAMEFVPGKSWIRLYSPEKNKIAGGARVKRIRINDNWANMAPGTGSSFEYGQEYDYTTFEVVKGDTLRYSSGVAAYEPMTGGDENPFRQPVFFDDKVLLAPDNQFYQEEPIGESFFPAPRIVYSKVTVRNLSHPNVERTATGSVVHEYYTAKDFPTITSTTGALPVPKKTNPIFAQLKLKHKDYMTASQGFVIELNDMHGKPKAQWVYDQSGTRLSGIEYEYKRDGNRLVNEGIPVVNPCGAITTAMVGLESSLVADSRESYSKTGSFGTQLNSDNFLAGVFPVLTIIPLPSFHQEETRFRSMTTTKVIQRYGILERTIAHDLGASVSTENVAWDAETGEVILTKTTNEFRDPVYNLNIPSHWAYEGMRGAYQNIGAVFSSITASSGTFTNVALQGFFTPGDEIAVNNSYRVWVKDVNRSTGTVYFIDEQGNAANLSNASLKIIRSGQRNQQLTSIGSVVSMKQPFNAAGNSLDFAGKEVLSAGAVEYSDRWQTWFEKDECNCDANEVMINEFLALLNYINAHKPSGASLFSNYSVQINSFLNSLPSSSPLINGLANCPPCNTNVPWLTSPVNVTSFFNSGIWTLGFSPCQCVIKVELPISIMSSSSIKNGQISFSSLVPNPEECDINKFLLNVISISLEDGNIFEFTAEGNSSCHNFYNSCVKKDACNPLSINNNTKIVNPYRSNNRGVYRPLRTWTYLTDRKQSASANIRTDGAFQNFSAFWQKPPVCPNSVHLNFPTWSKNEAGWTWASEATRHNPVGNELENRDALNRYSAELTGYFNTQVVATAVNARYRQIAFDGFEDYYFNNNYSPGAPCPQRHFGFDAALLSDEASHSGKYALKLAANAATEAKYEIKTPNCPTPLAPKPANVPFVLDDCDCVGVFSPDPGKYVFSAWVREDRQANVLNFDQASVQITAGGAPVTFKAAGPIIEGWQRIYGEFEVSAGATEILIELTGAAVSSWFDDFRIHPFDAGFKSFVYDDLNLRFTYELDENNFFTKYEYDQQGMLERVKKETERGVMTIQESRFGQQKN